MDWEVHVYEPGALAPLRRDSFDSFDAAFASAMTLKEKRPNGWHVHVHPPADATADQLEKLQLNALAPG